MISHEHLRIMARSDRGRDYVLNNPLILVDPTGEVWEIKGDDSAKEKLVQTANQNLQGKELKIDEKGNASLQSNGVQGPPTQEQAAFESTVSQVIDNKGTTTTTVVEGASQTAIGSLARGTIDIDDVRAFGPSNPASTGAVLAHEVAEQFASQVKGFSDAGAHGVGKLAENFVSGWTRGPDPPPLVRGRGGVSGAVSIPYARDGASATVTVTFRGGNVVDVTKRQ